MAARILGLHCNRRYLRVFAILLSFISTAIYLQLLVSSPGTEPILSDEHLSFDVDNFDPHVYYPPRDLVLPLPGPEHAPSSKIKIGKLTMLYPGPVPVYTRAIQSHKLHNQLHGYPMMVLRHSLLKGGTLDGLWNKPAYILAILLEEMRKEPIERLEWLCWFDADTVLLNPNVPLSLFLPPPSLPTASRIHFLFTRDMYALNNGVFLMRVSSLSVMLFTAVVAYRGYFPSRELAWQDQSVMIELLYGREEFRDVWRYVPQHWFNAYAGYAGYGNATDPDAVLFDEQPGISKEIVRRGDMLVHFPGWYAEDRERIMQRYLDSIESNSAWVVKLNELSLQSEVEEYWEQERDTPKLERA